MEKREKKTEKYDVVIIGGGAAGLTAGIYCGRAKLSTLVIEMSLVGGLATYTNEIENYPGFPDGSTGLELMELLHKQAKRFGVKFKGTEVKSAQLEGEVKTIETFRTNYEAKVVIVAAGGKPRLTGAKGEAEFLYDKGISFCATCDAAANTDKVVMVIGSGDAAIEEGMFLSKFADKVIISVMHDEGVMDCNEIAKEQALNNPKMEFIWNTLPEEFVGDEKHLNAVVLKNTKSGDLKTFNVDSCFLFIGYVPNTEIYRGVLDMNKPGNLITNEKMETNVSGVFGAGDVREKFLKQVATAVGDGAIAGYSAEKYIAESEVFETQIMGGDLSSVVFLWNAVEEGCRVLLPVVEAFEEKYKGKIKVSKVDIYKSKGLADRLNVTDVPAVVYIKDREIKETLTGEITSEMLDSLIK